MDPSAKCACRPADWPGGGCARAGAVWEAPGGPPGGAEELAGGVGLGNRPWPVNRPGVWPGNCPGNWPVDLGGQHRAVTGEECPFRNLKFAFAFGLWWLRRLSSPIGACRSGDRGALPRAFGSSVNTGGLCQQSRSGGCLGKEANLSDDSCRRCGSCVVTVTPLHPAKGGGDRHYSSRRSRQGGLSLPGPGPVLVKQLKAGSAMQNINGLCCSPR